MALVSSEYVFLVMYDKIVWCELLRLVICDNPVDFPKSGQHIYL